jgi:predicted MPP superfamily phosphohydrolase
MTATTNKKSKTKLPSKRMFTFLGMFALILLFSHFYMFMRISYYLQLTGQERGYVALLLGGFAFLTLLALPLSRLLPRWLANIVTWIVYPWMGIALLMFVTLLATDAVWLLVQLVPSVHLPEPRTLLKLCFGIVALSIVAILSGIALWKGVGPVSIKPVAITLKNLPKTLNGFRIVQLTDVHIGPMINGKWLRRVVNKVNALKPDLIVITGDLVDGSVQELGKHVAPLADLRAANGTFFVTGNHEYYSGAEEWCAYVTSLGIRVLRNERVSIPVNASADASFDLAGINDLASRHFPGEGADLNKALAGRDNHKTLILLAHQPVVIDEAAAMGVDLQLSGHTHGGQIWPFTYLVYLQQPYAKGLYHYNDTKTQIYVSPGTGFWGPPMRLGTTAEITHITLQSL